MLFGSILKYHRRRHGYAQKELADYFKISQSAYSKLENNITEPTIRHMILFVSFYKVSFKYVEYHLNNPSGK